MPVAICDSTLRDGNHAVRHQIAPEGIRNYARAAEAAGVDVIEVGHGNGIGASSLQVGLAAHSDSEMLAAAREVIGEAELGILAIPGFATLEGHLKPAIAAGVDVVRVGAHCTEADVTQQLMRSLARERVHVGGVLMMSHMASIPTLIDQGRLLTSYGADSVVIMDSAGRYLPDDVGRVIAALVDELDVPIGFHAHNNLGLAVANALTAVAEGAEIIDVTAKGFGAGAGNAPLELVAAAFHRAEVACKLDWQRAGAAANAAAQCLSAAPPLCTTLTIATGMAGIFSGFVNPVARASERFGIDAEELILELGRRRAVAGQEDLIVRVALEIAARSSS